MLGAVRRMIAELGPVLLVMASMGGALWTVVSSYERAGQPGPPPRKVEPEPAPAPRPVPVAVVAAPAPAPPIPVPSRPAPDPDAALRPLRAIEAGERQAAEVAQHQAEQLEASRRFLEERARSWRTREQLLKLQVAKRDRAARGLAQEVDRLAHLRDVLARRRDELQQDRILAEVRSRDGFAVVPYRGPNGTWRRPIPIECVNGEARIQPHGPSFSLLELSASFLGPRSGALSAVVDRLTRQAERQPSPDGAPVVPYVLFVVRPDGIRPYYEARAQLENLGITFGYELVEQDWDIEFPDLDDPDQWSEPSGPGAKPAGNLAGLGTGAGSGAAAGIAEGLGSGEPGVGDPGLGAASGAAGPGHTPRPAAGDRVAGRGNRPAVEGGGPGSFLWQSGVEGAGRGPGRTAGDALPGGGDLAAGPTGENRGGVASEPPSPERLTPRYPALDRPLIDPQARSREGRGDGVEPRQASRAPTRGGGSGVRTGAAGRTVAATSGPISGGGAGSSLGSVRDLDLEPVPGGSPTATTEGGTQPGRGSAAGVAVVSEGSAGAEGEGSGTGGGAGRGGQADPGWKPQPRLELVVVCGAQGVLIHPGAYRLSLSNLKSTDNRLVETLEAITVHQQAKHPQVQYRPSIRLLVEAGGQETYWKVRQQLLFTGLAWPVSLQVVEGDIHRHVGEVRR